MNRNSYKKLKPLLPLFVLPIFLIMVYFLLINPPTMPRQEVQGENGIWDLRDFDFENYNAVLVGAVPYIPNALLTPEEFATRSDEAIIGYTQGESFLTSRAIILMPDDGWYTFTRKSLLYAHRQYVNGEWIFNAGRGRPGYNRESEVPDEGWVVFTVQPEAGRIELISQSSTFARNRPHHHMGWVVGSGAGLVYEFRADDFLRGIELGSFFLLFLLFIMLFFMMYKNPAALYFSLFCLTWVMRMGVTGVWPFTVLMPWMDWAVKFRIQYIAMPVAGMLTIAIINSLFPKMLHKAAFRIVCGLSWLLIAVYVFADTVLVSDALWLAYTVYGLAIAYAIFRFVTKVRKLKLEQGIFIIGAIMFFFAVISDFFFFSFDFDIVAIELTGIGSLIFALCQAASVFIATMKEVEKAKEAEKRLAAENASLDALSRMKSEFLANISHEMKTPLMVISGYAQLSEEQLEAGTADEKTTDRLHAIFLETQRLSGFVNKLLADSATYGGYKIDSRVSVDEIINNAAAMCIPILDAKNNHLAIDIEKNCPDIKTNPDMIIPIFFNLVGNANRHVKNEAIQISAKQEGTMVLFNVRDNGKGIPPSLIDKIFERGISGDDSTGLGLAICKEVVEAHGGTITADNIPGGGANIAFTLPIYEEKGDTQ